MGGLPGTQDQFRMNEQDQKPDNPCKVCLLHSGVNTSIEHHERWLTTHGKRFNAMLMLLIADLALLVIFLLLHGLPKGG